VGSYTHPYACTYIIHIHICVCVLCAIYLYIYVHTQICMSCPFVRVCIYIERERERDREREKDGNVPAIGRFGDCQVLPYVPMLLNFAAAFQAIRTGSKNQFRVEKFRAGAAEPTRVVRRP
jgi:hypothetical protein